MPVYLKLLPHVCLFVLSCQSLGTSQAVYPKDIHGSAFAPSLNLLHHPRTLQSVIRTSFCEGISKQPPIRTRWKRAAPFMQAPAMSKSDNFAEDSSGLKVIPRLFQQLQSIHDNKHVNEVPAKLILDASNKLTMKDFSSGSGGWARCFRTTRISLMESAYCSVCLVLLPEKASIPPHDRPGAEWTAHKVLQGKVRSRLLQITFCAEDESIIAKIMQETKETGFHDSLKAFEWNRANDEEDCVCRGGRCPRREGCKFWVELMKDRFSRRKSRIASCMKNVLLDASQNAQVFEAGRGQLLQMANEGKGVACVLEISYGGGLTGNGTVESPRSTRYFHERNEMYGKRPDSPDGPGGQPIVVSELNDYPAEAPSEGYWSGESLKNMEMPEAVPQGAKMLDGSHGVKKTHRLLNLIRSAKSRLGLLDKTQKEVVEARKKQETSAEELHGKASNTAKKLVLGCTKDFDFAAYTLPGFRGESTKLNQDGYLCSAHCNNSDAQVGIFGVLDGHGARGHFVRDYLEAELLPTLQGLCLLDGGKEKEMELEGTCSSPLVHRQMLEAEIITRFLNVNRALLDQVDCTMSGSTCTLALVLPDVSGNKTIVFANLGDSRAVIGARRSEDSPLVSIDATIDHKPGIPQERKRITDSGGWVGVIDQMQKRIMLLEDSVDEGYDGQNIHFNRELIDSDSNPSFAYHNDILRKTARVFIPGSNLPGLAVSRSFGDEAVGHLGVTSSPEVTFLSCSPAHKFIVLATDGLWEVLTSQESVDIVGQHADADAGARALLDVASHRWQNRPPYIYRDDITVMVVYLPAN